MADKRAFAQFDVGYLDNPKIMDVFDASPIAVCMHIASVLYCAQHLTDGVIALRAMQRKVGGTETDATLLIDAGLWHLPGHECEQCPDVAEGKAYVHDYLQHNRTSDGVKGRSDAARIGANALWEKKRAAKERDANRMQTAYEPQSETDANAMPREKEREKELNTRSSPAKPSNEFDEWYSRYPKKEAKDAARKAFIKARKAASLQELLDGLDRYVASVSGKQREFIALPATWLNAGRWQDEIAAPTLSVVPAQYGWANR